MTTAVMSSADAVEQRGDADLADRLARGEAGALESAIDLYQQRVARLAQRLLGWSGDVDDVVQDVFLTALQKARRFRGECSVWTWLTVITLNRCRTHHRRQRLRRHVNELLWRRGAPTSTPADHGACADEVARAVRSAVAALAPRDREVIVLVYLEGKGVADVSRLLGASPNAIGVRLHRARATLRVALDPLMKD